MREIVALAVIGAALLLVDWQEVGPRTQKAFHERMAIAKRNIEGIVSPSEPRFVQEFRALAGQADICPAAEQARLQAVWFTQLAAIPPTPVKEAEDARKGSQFVAEATREACVVSKLSGQAFQDAVAKAAERLHSYAKALGYKPKS